MRGRGEKEVRLRDEEMDVGQVESAGGWGNEEHIVNKDTWYKGWGGVKKGREDGKEIFEVGEGDEFWTERKSFYLQIRKWRKREK